MKNRPILPCPNIHALPAIEIFWLLARSGEFDLIDSVEVPTYTYERIAENFTRSRRFRVSKISVWRLVRREDPELAARRGDTYPFAWKGSEEGALVRIAGQRGRESILMDAPHQFHPFA